MMTQRNAAYPYEDRSWPSTARERSPSYRSREENDYDHARAGPSRYRSDYERSSSGAYDHRRSYPSREIESSRSRAVDGYDSTPSRYDDGYGRSAHSQTSHYSADFRTREDVKEQYRRRSPSPTYRSSKDWERSNGQLDHRDHARFRLESNTDRQRNAQINESERDDVYRPRHHQSTSRFDTRRREDDRHADTRTERQRSARVDESEREDVYRHRHHHSTSRFDSRREHDRHTNNRSPATSGPRELGHNGKDVLDLETERSRQKLEISRSEGKQNGGEIGSRRSGERRSTQDDEDEDGLQQLWRKSNGSKEHLSRENDRNISEKMTYYRDRRPMEKLSLASKVLEKTFDRERGDLSNASDRQEYVQSVRRQIEDKQKNQGTPTKKKKVASFSFPKIFLPQELLQPENAQHLPLDARGEQMRSTRISYDPELDKEKDKKGKRILYHDLTKESNDPRNKTAKAKIRKELRLLHWKWDNHSTRSKPPPPPRSLVISGLSPMTVVLTVKRFFGSFGRIDECEIKTDSSGMSTGVCYLSFHHDYNDEMKLMDDVSQAKAQRGDLVAREARTRMNGQKVEGETVNIVFDDLDRTIFKKTYRELLQKKVDAASQKKDQVAQSPASAIASASTPSMPPPGAPRGPKTSINRNSLSSPKPTSPFSHSSRHHEIGRRTSHDDTDKDEIHSSRHILRQLESIGCPYAYVNRARGSTIGYDAMEKIFASMRPAWIKRDGGGFYIAFHQKDGADRAKKVLDGTSVSGYRISIEVRYPNDHTSDRHDDHRYRRDRRSASVDRRVEPVQTIPEKTTWTDEELFEDSKLLLMHELGSIFSRDLRSRLLSSFVTNLLLPENPCGKALRQPVKTINEQLEEELKVDLNAERPKSFNRAAKEERRLKLERQIKDEEEAAARALAKANQILSDEEEEEDEAIERQDAKSKTKKSKAKTKKSTEDGKLVKTQKAQKKVVYSPSPEPIDPFVSGLVEEEEDLYYCRMALEMIREGQDPQDLPDEEEFKEESRQFHASGSARTEGFYRIPPAEKGKHLADRNMASSTEWGSTTAVSTVGLASARDNRADSRRFVQGIEQHKKDTATDTDILKFNQLRSRKKQLKFAKSPIHDWGLYAMEAIPAGDMVIEYVGEIVRQQVADEREKMYERQGNFSTYLFRVDDDIVVDATKKGNIARLMNHCCTPNCNAKILTLNGEKRIVLYAKQLILPGQELTYDYKFQGSGDEEDAIACLCGSPGCRRFL